MTSTSDESRAKVTEIVEQAESCMLTTMTDDGRHVSRPMAVQEVEFDGDLWFFADGESDKIGQLRSNPQVNVAFADDKRKSWTSMSGTAEVVRDRATMERLWSAPLKVWFPDGIETPGISLIKVNVETAEYWDASSSPVKRLIGAVRAAVTDDPDKFPATNETTRLEP